MTYLGLLLIILGWLLQFFSKDSKVKRSFVITYAVGVAFLVLDAYMNDQLMLAVLNFFSLISAVLVYQKIKQ